MKKTLIFILILTLIVSQEATERSRRAQSNENTIGTCAKFTSDRQSCLECIPHYHLFEGQCYIDINGCKEYVFGNICRKCDHGFILVNNECCDRHCMSKIFKGYEIAAEQQTLTDQQKLERTITVGLERVSESIISLRYSFVKFQLISTSNQVLSGYIRYFIKILANDKLYRCIADFEILTNKVFAAEFRLESESLAIKQVIHSQSDVISIEQARVAVQFASAKFGLKTYGSSLERVSSMTYKFAMQFRLIYIGSESAYIINVVVPTVNKRQSPYSPWSQQRKDVQAIKSVVDKSMTVVKMQNKPELEVIKQKISQTNSIKKTEVQMKTIQKVKQNVYKYTFVNEQTKQVFEQVSRVDPKTKKVQIIEHKQVINKDIQNMKLPESSEKKIITKESAPETPEVKEVIKYFERVQPSLATKQITSAAIETIGQVKKITLIQQKNNQVSRVVVLQNPKNQHQIIDQSKVKPEPTTSTQYTTTPEGKPKITTTDIEKFRTIDKQVDKIVQKVEKTLPFVKLPNIESLQKVEGNTVNTYTIVTKGQTPQEPKQQVTVIHNVQTKQVRVIDIEQIKKPVFVEPIKRQPTPIPETQFKTQQVKSIIEQFKVTKPQLKDTEVVIKKADVQETKFVNQYTVVVETTKGQTITIKANKPHEQQQPQIISVKPAYQKPTQQPKVQQSYTSKVTVNQVTGVKTVTTTKPEQIKQSFVTQVLSTITTTKQQPKVQQIQTVVRKQYENTVVQTVVIKEEKKYVQVTVEQDKRTKQVKKVSEQVIKPVVQQSKPVMPVTSTTHISEKTFSQVVKTNPVLQTVTERVVKQIPALRDQIPKTTEVQQRGPVQVVTFVYENKQTNEKKRIVTEYNKQTQKTTVKQQTPLPRVIPGQYFEKDITPEGEVKVVTSSVQTIKKQDKNYEKVIKQVEQKIPIVRQTPKLIEVVQNPISTTYKVTVQEQKKPQVTVSFIYDVKTTKVTVNDIVQAPKPETVIPRPVEKPVNVLKPQELKQPQVKNVVKFVQNTVKSEQITEVREIKNTMSTSYQVVTKTSEGPKTVSVVVNNNDSTDIVLVDVSQPVRPQATSPVEAPKPSTTTVLVDSVNVKSTTTNDKTTITSSKYLKTIITEAKKVRPSLSVESVVCEVQDEFVATRQTTVIFQVNGKRTLVSGFVSQSGETFMLETSGTDEQPTTPQYSDCSERPSSITSLTSQAIQTLSKTDKQIGSLVSYVNQQFSVDKINKVLVERFTRYIKYVITVTISSKTYRIVLVYEIKTTKYTVIQKPNVVRLSKPIVFEQTTTQDGTKIVTSNNVQQVKTVDQKVQKFVQVLNQQVPIKQSQIVSITSVQNTNTNDYTVVYKTSQKTTSQIKAVLKKQDDTVIVQQVQEKPKQLIAPLVKPKVEVPKEQYTSETITKVIKEVNINKQIPNIQVEKIVQVTKTQTTPQTETYTVVSETKQGKKQVFIVNKNSDNQMTVVDYKPAPQPARPEQPRPAQPAPSKTQYTVNPVSGIETLKTNDVQVIKQSRSIQNVISKVVEQKTVTRKSEVISAVTKTSDNEVQTKLVMKSPERPQENVVVVAIVNKKTEQVTVVSQKVVEDKTPEKPATVQQNVVEAVYSPSVIQKTIREDKVLQSVVNKIAELHKTEVKDRMPDQIVAQTVGDKTIFTASYTGSIISTTVYDKKTDTVKQISSQPIPKNIQPLTFETSKQPDGTTVVTTNSVQKAKQIVKTVPEIIADIKKSIPDIQTQKIQGIRIQKTDQPEAPKKVTIVFETNTKQLKQTTVVHTSDKKTSIVDVQTFRPEEVMPSIEQSVPVKLTANEIKDLKVEQNIKSNIKQLPFKQVKKIVEVRETKTTYSTILDTTVQDTTGKTYTVKTEQTGSQQPRVLDFTEISPQKKTKQAFTVTTTNPKNGIVSTYTNDVKVMNDEKTYSKVVDVLENKYQLTKNGFVVDSDSISRLQRSVEHNIRFVNEQTKEAIDIRVIVDTRTGLATVNQKTVTKYSEEKPLLNAPAQKNYIQIYKNQLPEGKAKYPFIVTSIEVLRKADYTFQNKQPQLTQIKQYSSTQTNSNGEIVQGVSTVEVVMTFDIATGSTTRRTRVVLNGEQKAPGQKHIMKIIDMNPIPKDIDSVTTKVTKDQYGRKTTVTTDIKALQQNNQQYNKVMEKIIEEIPNLSTASTNSATILENKKSNQFSFTFKKENQIIETKATIMKDSGQIVISDFRTQSPKVQLQKVPIKPSSSVETIVPKEKLTDTTFITMKQVIKSEKHISGDIDITSAKLEQRPRADTYILKVTDQNDVVSTVQVLKKDDSYTVISYKPERPARPEQPKQPEQPKPSTTTFKVDQVTGSQILTTNDKKVIKESKVIQNVVRQVIEQKQIPRNVEVVSAVTKTSENKIQTTFVLQQPQRPKQRLVFVTVTDKNDDKNTQVISHVTQQIQSTQSNTQQVYTTEVCQIVITKTVYQTVIKKNTHLQNIVKSVQTKYPETKNIQPERVTMQAIGPKTITQFVVRNEVYTIVSQTQGQNVVTATKQPIPEERSPGTVQTVINQQGTKTVTTTNPVILKQVQPQYERVVEKITKQFKTEQIKTVQAKQTKFGHILTVVSQTTEQPEPKQTTYYVNKQTKQVVKMGTEQIPLTSTPVKPVSQPEPVKNVPETKWETKQIKSVIKQVTTVVKQQKVTKVEQLKPTPLVKFYQVTVDTPQGPQVVKVTYDIQTKKVQVLEQKQPERPVQQPRPQQPQKPSQTTVTVDKTSGVKTTTTTDTQVIRTDKVTKKVVQSIVEQVPELKKTEIVATTKKDYENIVEEKVILKSDKTTTQVVTVFNKKTQTVKIIDQSQVQSVKPTTTEVKVTETSYQQVYNRDDILRKAVEFVTKRYPQFKGVKPSETSIQQYTQYIKFTFVFSQSTTDSTKFRIVVVFNKKTNSFQVLEQPLLVEQQKEIILETVRDQFGRQTVFTNDVEQLTTVDKNVEKMFSQLNKQINVNTDDVSSIKSTLTSTGSVYTISTTSNQETTQINVVYNKDTNTVKINEVETVKAPEVQPTQRPTVSVPLSNLQENDDISLIIRESQRLGVPTFTTEQISKVDKSTTVMGIQYIITIRRVGGQAVLTVLITSSTSSGRKVTLISYITPRSEQPDQQPLTQAPSKTQVSYDVVSGSQIQSTNDVKIIESSKVIKNVVQQLVESSTIPKDSKVVSTVTKDTTDSIKTTMVVKTSETESKVVVTVTDKKTNDVKVVAEKPIPRQVFEQFKEVTQVSEPTIITKTTFDQHIKRDVILQNVIEQVRNNHPEIKEEKPVQVRTEKFDDKVVTEVVYKQVTSIVVTDTKTNKVQQVTSSPVPKQTDRKPVTLETVITEQGTKVVTSNTVEEIVKVVPSVKPAVQEIVRQMPTIKYEQIKTVRAEPETNIYYVITTDKTDVVREVKFQYQPEQPKPIRLIDVQQFTQESVPVKPRQIVYQTVKIEEQPEIIRTIEKVNKTSSVVKSQIKQVTKIEKATTSMTDSYIVYVKTPTTEQATIKIEYNPETQKHEVIDVIKYEPQKQQPKVVKIQEVINPVTLTKQTVYPTKETFQHDQIFNKVNEQLKQQIDKGYKISSAIKETYGQNEQVKVLLKSEDKSPEQVVLRYNKFDKEMTVVHQKTIVSQVTEQTSVITQEQPKPIEIKLSPVEEQRFEIMSKIQSIKTTDDFKPVPDVKLLEKNDLFVKVDQQLKEKYETILRDSNIHYVASKQGLDSTQYNTYYVDNKHDTKTIYEAKFEINPITQTHQIKSFSKVVNSPNPQKSSLNVVADMAYGYEPLEDFSNDKNIKFVMEEIKKHYPALENAVIQSVEVLSLCNGRFNYRFFFKSGLEVVKYIVFYEQAFQRLVYLAGEQFSIGGGNFETLQKDELKGQIYFKQMNQVVKEQNKDLAEDSQILLVERQDNGETYSYRTMYTKGGKTFHIQSQVDKNNMVVTIKSQSELISVPRNRASQSAADHSSTSILRINDLAHNANFEKVYRQILAKQGSFLQSAQLVGAIQNSEMFITRFKLVFMNKGNRFQISAFIDSTTKVVTIDSQLVKINLDGGHKSSSPNDETIKSAIQYAKRSNPDLNSGVVIEASQKKAIFGDLFKIIFKLQTKYYKLVIYKQGTEYNVLNQNESTTLQSQIPAVKSFPRPSRRNSEVVLNKGQ